MFNLTKPLNDQKESSTKLICMMVEMNFLAFKDIDTKLFPYLGSMLEMDQSKFHYSDRYLMWNLL